MKRKFFSLFLSVFVVFTTFSFYGNMKTSYDYNRQTAEIVIEKNTGRILYEKNARQKMYMASTTKILTAITIIENCNLTDVVTITKESVGIEGSSIYLEEGEKLSVKDLLYGMMLRSGNDCATALSIYCSKNTKDFAKLMNETAEKIGAKNSNFVNAHGLHNDNHYTTAYDLALISAYAMKNPTFKEIVSTKKITIPFTTRDYDRLLINKNKMLKNYDGATGIKTGYTKKAGRCLVSSAERDGMELICVVLNCGPMWEKSAANLDACFSEYKPKKYLESDNIVDFIDNDSSDEKTALYVKNDVYLPVKNNETVKVENDYPKKLTKQLNHGDEVGAINFYIQNQLIFSEKVYIM